MATCEHETKAIILMLHTLASRLVLSKRVLCARVSGSCASTAIPTAQLPSSSARIVSSTIAQTERSSKPPSKLRNTIPRRPSSQERCGQITSYQNRTPYELATGQSDHLEDLVMFEGGAAAKCARPSWISHRSAWRTATKKKLTGTTGIIVSFGPLTLRTVSRASTTATSRLIKRTRWLENAA